MRTLVLLFSAIVAGLAAASFPAEAQSAIILEPEVVIEEFYAFPHEGSANKLSSAYAYPEVRYIDAYLRVETGGFVGERKATAFVTMSCEDEGLAKKKEKLKLKAGR